MQKVLKTLLLLSLFVLGACGGPESQPEAQEAGATPAGTRADPYVVSGVIQEVRDGQLVIEHGEIPGLMGGMTMPYAVAPDVEIDRFAVGDTVRFELELPGPNEYLIIGVEEGEGEALQ